MNTRNGNNDDLFVESAMKVMTNREKDYLSVLDVDSISPRVLVPDFLLLMREQTVSWQIVCCAIQSQRVLSRWDLPKVINPTSTKSVPVRHFIMHYTTLIKQRNPFSIASVQTRRRS